MKIKSPWLWGANGSAGDMTISDWNGIKVGKGKIRRMTNPNTLPQQKNRKRRKVQGKLYEGLGPFIQESVEKKIVGQSKFSQLLKQLNPAVTVNDSLVITVDFPAVPYSIGTLDTVPPGATVAISSGEVALTLPPNNPATASDDDWIYIVELNAATGQTRVTNSAGKRSTNTNQTINYLPLSTSDGTIHVYVVFLNLETLKSSNTSYIGSYILA